jgi:hypothetical protein
MYWRGSCIPGVDLVSRLVYAQTNLSQQTNSSYLIFLRQSPRTVALFRLHVLLDHTMPSTINNFLEPWQGLGADDLLHTLADSAGPSSVDR